MNTPQSHIQAMSRNEFLRLMEEILHRPTGSLHGPELLRDAEEWDSTAILEFMAMVDSRLGVTVDVETILASETYEDLYSLVER